MTNACHKLFQYACKSISPRDIAEYAPYDPGYDDYVREFRQILAQTFPPRAGFDFTEPIGLNRSADANLESDPEKFRRFRVFTNSAALVMDVIGRVKGSCDLPPNYTLISLIDDAAELKDKTLWKLMLPAFEQAHLTWKQRREEEAMFGCLAVLLMNAQLGSDAKTLDDLANQLIKEETLCETWHRPIFLFRCTNYDQLNHLWKQQIAELIQPHTPNLAAIRDAMLNSKPYVKL